MKRVVLFLCILLTFPAAVQAFQINLFGVPVTGKHDWPKVLYGAAASFLVHEAGHYAYAQAQGFEPEYHFTHVSCDHTPDENFARAGFVAQLIVGSVLRHLDSDIAFGFIGYSAGQAGMYTITGGITEYSDVSAMEHGRLEAGIFTAFNMYLIKEVAHGQRNRKMPRNMDRGNDTGIFRFDGSRSGGSGAGGSVVSEFGSIARYLRVPGLFG